LVQPVANFELAGDEMRILEDEGVRVHPVRTVLTSNQIVFSLDQNELIGKIKERFESVAKPTLRF